MKRSKRSKRWLVICGTARSFHEAHGRLSPDIYWPPVPWTNAAPTLLVGKKNTTPIVPWTNSG